MQTRWLPATILNACPICILSCSKIRSASVMGRTPAPISSLSTLSSATSTPIWSLVATAMRAIENSARLIARPPPSMISLQSAGRGSITVT
jgi:hypothetical protein